MTCFHSWAYSPTQANSLTHSPAYPKQSNNLNNIKQYLFTLSKWVQNCLRLVNCSEKACNLPQVEYKITSCITALLPFSSRAIPARLQGLRSHPGPWWRQHSGLSFRSIIRSCKDLQQTNRSEKIKTGIKQEIPTYSTIQNRLRLVSYIEKTCNFPIHASHLLTLFERWTAKLHGYGPHPIP